jgi:lysophospholipase L1-like esterase
MFGKFKGVLIFFLIISVLLGIFSLFSTERSVKKESNIFAGTRYLTFGDSITHGNWLEDSYPELVADELGSKGYSNRGMGGSTYVYQSNRGCITDTVLSTLDKVGHYDIISVGGGGNDHDLSLPLGNINDKTKETVYGSLNIIAEALKERQEDSFVFFITPLMSKNERVNYEGYRRKDVATAVVEVGKKHGIPVLDLYSTSDFENVACGMNHPDCDGTHPIQEYMNDYMAPKIVDFIRKNYK